jgi:hypothetical protein
MSNFNAQAYTDLYAALSPEMKVFPQNVISPFWRDRFYLCYIITDFMTAWLALKGKAPITQEQMFGRRIRKFPCSQIFTYYTILRLQLLSLYDLSDDWILPRM